MTILKRAIFGLLALLLAVAVGVFAVERGASLGGVVALLVTSMGLAGAIVATPVQTTNNWRTWNITSLDADTTVSIAHGFGAAGPDAAWIQSALSQGTTNTSTWGLSVVGTQIVLLKQNATGSGGTTPGTSVVAKVFAWRPHSAAR